MPEQKKSIRAAQSLSGLRLDVALAKAGLAETRSQAQRMIDEHVAWVNDEHEKRSYKVQVGDLLEVLKDEKKSLELTPYAFDLDIVFEDDSLLVVNKPAGLVVHPAYGHEDDTLINALLYRQTKLAPSEDPFRPGLVHRIDKGTSGLLVLAKTERAHHLLAKQFLKKTIHRRYWALCFNNRPMESGTIESYLTRDPKNRQRFISTDKKIGKHAITHYRALAHRGPFSLFELQLETGRTHQIRVHLSSNNNPIVGDDVYNGKNQAKNLNNMKLRDHVLNMDRFALHARELGFSHPESQQFISFSVPIPSDLEYLFLEGGFGEFL